MRPQINLPQISDHRWHIWYTSKFQTPNNFAYPKLQAPNKHIILAPLFQKSRSAPPPKVLHFLCPITLLLFIQIISSLVQRHIWSYICHTKIWSKLSILYFAKLYFDNVICKPPIGHSPPLAD